MKSHYVEVGRGEQIKVKYICDCVNYRMKCLSLCNKRIVSIVSGADCKLVIMIGYFGQRETFHHLRGSFGGILIFFLG